MQKNIKPFSRVFEKANFPHFRHDNSADIQYLNISGQVVTPLINISLEIMHTKLLKFKHKGRCSGNHGNHNN